MYIRKPNKVSNLSVGAAVPMSFKLEIQVHEHYNLSLWKIGIQGMSECYTILGKILHKSKQILKSKLYFKVCTYDISDTFTKCLTSFHLVSRSINSCIGANSLFSINENSYKTV